MCALDATTLGVADGERVRVWNRRAELRVPVRVTERLRPRVVAIPFGWWSAHHEDGRVANSLTNDTLTDWGGGVAFSDTLVAVERA
jgi:anaerobic selenocysteine-containing dehydrogenase